MEQAIEILSELYDQYLDNYKANGRTDFDAGRVDALKMAIEELNKAK